MARTLEETSQFKRDKKRIKGSGRYDWEKMRAIVKELINDRPLEHKYRDYELSGEYAGVRECHVEDIKKRGWLDLFAVSANQG